MLIKIASPFSAYGTTNHGRNTSIIFQMISQQPFLCWSLLFTRILLLVIDRRGRATRILQKLEGLIYGAINHTELSLSLDQRCPLITDRTAPDIMATLPSISHIIIIVNRVNEKRSDFAVSCITWISSEEILIWTFWGKKQEWKFQTTLKFFKKQYKNFSILRYLNVRDWKNVFTSYRIQNFMRYRWIGRLTTELSLLGIDIITLVLVVASYLLLPSRI